MWFYASSWPFSEKTGKAWVWGLTSCGGPHPAAIDKILFLHFYREEEKVNKGFSLPQQQTVGVGDSMQGEISFTMTNKNERKFIQHFLILFSCSFFKRYELFVFWMSNLDGHFWTNKNDLTAGHKLLIMDFVILSSWLRYLLWQYWLPQKTQAHGQCSVVIMHDICI